MLNGVTGMWRLPSNAPTSAAASNFTASGLSDRREVCETGDARLAAADKGVDMDMTPATPGWGFRDVAVLPRTLR